MTIIAATCSECNQPVGLRSEEDNVSLATYPDGTVMFLFRCSKCGKRSRRKTEPSSYYGASVVEITQRLGIPIIPMPEHELPAECDFPPFEPDDLIDYMLRLDTIIDKLRETDG